MKFESNLDGLIECLQTIRKYANGDTSVNISLIGDRNVPLQNIYYHNVGGEENIYIEGEYNDGAELSDTFSLYDTCDIIEESEEKERQRLKELTVEEPLVYQSVLDDIDKVYDIMNLDLDKKGFLAFYSYLKEEEYDLTMADIKPLKSEYDMSDHNQNIVGNVANLMRQAENLHIEDINGRPNGWNVTGEEMKWRIADWVSEHFTDAQTQLFRELCNSMGV